MSKEPSPPVNPGGRIATLIVGVAFVIGVIALVILAVTRQNAPSAVGNASVAASPPASQTPVPRPSETPGVHYPSQGHPGHDKKDPNDPAVAGFKYNSDPPTSGMHLENFSTELINTKPLPKWMQVHLLEHGNVLMQYNCSCPDVAGALAQIAELYNNRLLPAGQTTFTSDIVQGIEERGTGVIVAPYPGMKHKIALTAWTRLQTFDAIDQNAMMRFINAYLANSANAMQ